MRRYIRTERPQRSSSKLHSEARSTVFRRPTITRHDIVKRVERHSVELRAAINPASFQIDPYLDYGRTLTPEGGILIFYKDLDLRLRHTLWRIFAWVSFTGTEADYLFNFAPLQNQWVTIGALFTAAVINWLIVAKPVELLRQIEIRPDCMIIDGGDVFWAHFIEGGLPSCRPDADGNQVFSGIYGTRFVEYLTIRRFDEHDRMPEVMSAHLQDAIRQLWIVPH